MKEVTLKRIVIDHWRGQKMDLQFDGNTVIYGRNKVGKSTIFNAFLWVLTGFDSEDRSNYQLFDNKLEMTYENAIPAEASVFLDIDDNEYKFTRVAKQSWSRKRGESEYTKGASDNYSFYIDDIELTSGEYKKRIEEMFCPIDSLKVILNIKYIYLLDWKVQRELFASICDEITEADFTGNYKELFQELKKYSLSELESRIKTLSDPLKSQLKSLPLTIETLIGGLPDISSMEEAKTKIKENEEKISDIDKELQGSADSISPFIERRDKQLEVIRQKERDLEDKKYNFGREETTKVSEIKQKIQDVNSYNKRIEYANESNRKKREDLEARIKKNEELITECDNRRARLLQEKNEAKALIFNAYTCSYCRQELPEDKIEAAKKKFEDNKNEQVAAIIKKGKDNNAVKDKIIEENESLRKQIEEIPSNEELASTEELEIELANAMQNVVVFENTAEYSTLVAEIEELKKNVTEIPEQDNAMLLKMKEVLMKEIKEYSEIVGLSKERTKQEARINDLKQQLRSCAQDLAIQEKLEHQLKAYKQEHADIVSNKVNVMLKRCHVTMMEQNKSGNFVPSCTITTGGIVSTVYNAAEKILTGIDISEAFSKHHNLNMPLFIDNAEGISPENDIETERQIIKLVVREGDMEHVKL